MWENWTTLQQIFFCVAVAFSIILVLQLILMLVGAGHDDAGIDLNGDGNADITVDTSDGLALFTVKGLVSFFAVGGWVGFALGDGTIPYEWAVVIAVASGLVALVLVGLIMKWLIKLQASGNMNINNAVGKTAEVYLTVPANMAGAGKITVELQGSLTELSAVTEGNETIVTGSKVRIVRTDDSTCYVEKLY